VNLGRVAATLLACVLLGSCSSTSSASSASAGTSAGTSTGFAASLPAAMSSATGPASTTETTSAKAVSATTAVGTTPTTTAAAWTLSISGLGPLALGTSYSVLEAQGYVSASTDQCLPSRTSKKLEDEGVELFAKGTGATAVLLEVRGNKPTYATVSGAKVGDTMKRLRQLYGSQLTTETPNDNGGPPGRGPIRVATIHIGTREVMFVFASGASLGDSDVVYTMIARTWSLDAGIAGC
jgi:hypothetical protein